RARPVQPGLPPDGSRGRVAQRHPREIAARERLTETTTGHAADGRRLKARRKRTGVLFGTRRARQMRSSGIRPTHFALGFGALLAYAVGLPTKAQGAVCHAYFAIFQHGSCSTTTSQGCFEDSDCPGGEN